MSDSMLVDEFDMDTSAICAMCGAKLEVIRPGKYQCDECERGAAESARQDWEDAMATLPPVDYASMSSLELARALERADYGLEGTDMPEFAWNQRRSALIEAQMDVNDAELTRLRGEVERNGWLIDELRGRRFEALPENVRNSIVKMYLDKIDKKV